MRGGWGVVERKEREGDRERVKEKGREKSEGSDERKRRARHEESSMSRK